MVVVYEGIEFIHTVAVVADANVTSLDIANVAGNFHFGLHAKLVNEGDGLDRVWLLHVEAEYAVNYPTDQLPFTFCVLLTVKIYLAAVLAVQLAEGGPRAGLPLHNLDEAGSCSWWRRRWWRRRWWSLLRCRADFTSLSSWSRCFGCSIASSTGTCPLPCCGATTLATSASCRLINVSI